MEDILDLHHEDLDYEEDLEEGSPPAKKLCAGCPVEGCKFDPGRGSLKEHWHNVHQKEIVLQYCPLPRCGFRSRTLDRVKGHLGTRHRLTSAQCSAVMALPVVAEMKKNLSYRDPGDVAAPVSPEAVPVDAIHPSEKMSREDLVKSAIREAALPAPAPAVPVPVALVPAVPVSPFPVPAVVPLMSLLLEEPPHKRTVVITEKPATVSKPPPSPEKSPPLVALLPEEQQPLVAPLPEEQPLVSQQTPVAPAPEPCQPLEILSLETPFLDCFCGDTCAPRYTAPAAELTTTDSCTETRAIPCTSTAELATLASLIHSVPDGDASSSLQAPKVAEEPSVSSAATTPTPTGEPIWLPAEEQLEDLEAWLSHLPDELQAPPSPKPAKVVSRIEAAGGLQSKATGSSKSEEMSGRYLRSRLRSLDAAMNCLQKIRRDLQESVTEAHKHEVLDKEVENRELRRRVRYLEAQLQRSQTGHSTLPTKVGDLQNLSTTRAFVLFPNIGRTAVYSLEPEDVRLLDLANRSEPLSCDHL